MAKGRDRGTNKRGFDDDVFNMPEMRSDRPRRPFSAPARSMAPAPEGPPIEATVKWFNPEKGFGFVALADGSGDAFLHVAVLRTTGYEQVEPGTKLRVQVGQGQKGRQVAAVLEVDPSTAAPSQPRRSERSAPLRSTPDPSTAVDLSGSVKWFNTDKGFGFIVAEDGGKDVFVHISVVEKAGLRDLAEGQRVMMKVVQTQKGREAISISLH